MSYRFDPELVEIIGMLPVSTITDIAAARTQFDTMIEPLNASVDTTGLIVDEAEAPGPEGAPPVPVRVYRPEGGGGPRPGLLTIHGGGFVLGNIAMEHGSAVQIARALDAVVVAVEYRLAPEHPFPAGVEDCYAALVWFAAHAAELGVDPARIAVGGQSAGGGLSAGVALLARDRGGPPLCFQFLGIPELDDRLDTVSMRTFVDTPMWSRPNAELSWQYYLGDAHGGEVSPYAAPARATDLSGLPPAYVTTMEYDPLRDEGITYALRLLQAGVSVELHSFPGTFHGSALVRTAAVSRRGNDEMLEALRRGLA
jgi:acetyl esterase/lipase